MEIILRKVIGTYEGVEISEHWIGSVLSEVEYNIYDQDSYINYAYIEGKVEVVSSRSADGVFQDFLPTLDQLNVIHNHLIVAAFKEWNSYEQHANN